MVAVSIFYTPGTGYIQEILSMATQALIAQHGPSGLSELMDQHEAVPWVDGMWIGEREYVTSIDTDTPFRSPRPTLAVDVAEIATDGLATATVTVPTGVTVEVLANGVAVATATGEDLILGPAYEPVTWRLVPSWPYREAEVIAR